MAFYKFNPGMSTAGDLEKISVGRDDLIKYTVERIKNSTMSGSTSQILFLGPSGIGKSHVLLRIFHRLSGAGATLVSLGVEEYSISCLDDLCRRILETLGISCNADDAISYCRHRLNGLRDDGRPVVLFVENLQMLFGQIRSDLGKLRSIIQSDQSLSVVGSAPAYFDPITSPDEPFYRFFDAQYLRDLTEDESYELVRKRLMVDKKEFLLKSLEERADHIRGILMLAGGNPRIVHMLAEIIMQRNSLEHPGECLLILLDQLTPYYQARTMTMTHEQRKIFDVIALAEGPLSPTEIARRLDISPPTAVTQLRRLQGNGILDNVKFSSKRGTKYQITERLYRMWRELYLTQNAARVRLFLDFIRLWHMRAGPAGDHNSGTGTGPYDWASFAGLMRCPVDFGTGMLRLGTVVERLVLSNQLEDARQEILHAREQNRQEKDKTLRQATEAFINVVELDCISGSAGHEYGGRSVPDMINRLGKHQTVIPKDAADRRKLHLICEGVASRLISVGQYESALHFNGIARDCTKNTRFCPAVFAQRAQINMSLGRYEDALMSVNAILKREPENPHALSGRVHCLRLLGRRDPAVKAARQLAASDVEYFADASRPFIDFKLERDLLELTKHFAKTLPGLEPDRRSACLRRCLGMLLHGLTSAIAGNRSGQYRFFAAVLSVLRDVVESGDLMHGCAAGIFNHPKGIKALPEAVPVILEAFGPDKSEELLPLLHATEYAASRDVSILERLHPEMRQLVIQIIQRIYPDVPIGEDILDSVSA